MTRWIPVLFLALALAVASVAAQEDVAPDTDEALYLKAGPTEFGAGNFTTIRPTAALAARVEPSVLSFFDVEWAWKMYKTPEPYTLEKGDTVRAWFVLSDMERMVPVSDPTTDPTAMGQHRLTLSILNTTNVTNPVASVSMLLPAASPLDSNVLIPIDAELPVLRTNRWADVEGNASYFMFYVHLTGRMPNDNQVSILVDGGDHPAGVISPGFPRSAFAAWEAQEAAERACNERILEGGTCEVEVPATDGPVGESASGGWLVAWSVLGAVLVAGRRFRPGSRTGT